MSGSCWVRVGLVSGSFRASVEFVSGSCWVRVEFVSSSCRFTDKQFSDGEPSTLCHFFIPIYPLQTLVQTIEARSNEDQSR